MNATKAFWVFNFVNQPRPLEFLTILERNVQSQLYYNYSFLLPFSNCLRTSLMRNILEESRVLMNFEQNHHSLQRNALPPILFSLLSLFLKFNLCKIQILLNYKYLSIITGSVISKVRSLLLKQIIKKKKHLWKKEETWV